MRLTILGCSGSVPGPRANASGYLVEAGGFALGLDLGNGTLAELQALRDPFALDALVLSHLHPDHCADVASLTVLRRFHPDRPGRRCDDSDSRLPVYGPEETSERLAHLYAPDAAERARTDLSDVFTFAGLPREPQEIGPLQVQAHPVRHPTPTFGLRIEHEGRVLAYTSDTDVCPELDVLAASADVLLAEATWTAAEDRPVGVHLSGRAAGELAARAGVGALLLTHIAPWTDRAQLYAEAHAAFGGPVTLVEQGRGYPV